MPSIHQSYDDPDEYAVMIFLGLGMAILILIAIVFFGPRIAP